MRKLVLFMHVSLDGFVAGPNGEMDWIHVDEELFDYSGQRIDAANMALYGRTTYEMMQSYWPTAAEKPDATKHDIDHSRWYNKVEKIVLSRTMQGIHLPNTTIISENLTEAIGAFKESQDGEIVIFGSPGAAHSLMAEGLIDEYWLFVNPILLGEGIPVFADIQQKIALRLVNSHVFSSGVVCLHYERIGNE